MAHITLNYIDHYLPINDPTLSGVRLLLEDGALQVESDGESLVISATGPLSIVTLASNEIRIKVLKPIPGRTTLLK